MSATRFLSSLLSSNESSNDLTNAVSGESEPHSVQSAIVRTLADAIAHHEASGDAPDGLREQLVEAMDRLGSCRIEAASPR